MSRKIGLTIEPGTLLWVPEADPRAPRVFCPAKVLAVDEYGATVRTENANPRLETIDLDKGPLFLANPTVEPDMTSLHYIHEPGILYNLSQRSLKSEPYTFMGSVLVSVNPLRRLSNPDSVGTRQVLHAGPHPYAVAESAFQQMTFQGARELITTGGSLKKASQSIVIGGESGAGKTESSKMVLQHLVQRQKGGSKGTNGLDQRLLGTNPILEAFGNATTLRNPNSSRFGKMLRLHFESPENGPKGTDEDWCLVGATVQSYLLERSRVTSHAQGERGYHIMYYVIAGAKRKEDALLDGLSLDKGAKAFRYSCPEHPRFDEEYDLNFVPELIQAFKDIGLTQAEIKMVFEIVAAILHMGNIQFEEEDSTEGPKAKVSAAEEPHSLASSLLGVDAALLARTFCERRFTVAGSEMVTPRNGKAASFARDAIAKALYSGLFDWIMKKIDIALGGSNTNPDRTSTIGVLDIFGFESFTVNGFEQLLINYTNEALQGTFNKQIFIAEAALYQKEGLFGTDEYVGRPLDNGMCIELLQGIPGVKGKEHGILMTIDSEGRVPDPSDGKLNQRLHMNFGTHPCMIKPHQKDKTTTFIIRHYAATVVYTVGSFLEKNNDRLPDDMESTLKTSTKSVVREVFTPQEDVPGPPPAAAPAGKKPPQAPRKPPARSIVHKFQGQIKALVDDLESTKCSFIRCVKPNAAMIRDDSDPSWFDEKYVKLQLDALNIAQTAEVLRNGFPTRIDYSSLVEQYSSLLPPAALASWKRSGDSRAFVRAIFYAFGIDEESFKLGFTKVFFKGGKLAELNNVMKATQLSEDIVKKFKFFLIRIKWRKAYAYVRGLAGFTELYNYVRSKVELAIKVQALFRARRERKRFRDLGRGARVAQKLWRGKLARKAYAAKRAEILEEAKRRAEEARKKKDRQALEKAERLEKGQRELQAKLERDEREKQAQVEAALEKQREEQERLKEEQEDITIDRRMTLLGGGAGNNGRRKTVAVTTGKKKTRKTVVVRQGGALKPQSYFQPPPPPPPPAPVIEQKDPEEELLANIPPPPRMFATATGRDDDSDDDDHPPVPEERTSSRSRVKIKSLKRGSFFDFIAEKQESDFKMPVSGYCYYKEPNNGGRKSIVVPQDKRKSKGAGGVLARLLSIKPKWVRAFYVLNKPDRSLTLYKEMNDRKDTLGNIHLHKECKVWKYEEDKKKPFGIELEDPVKRTVAFFAFETETLWRRWMKDVNEAIYGFRAAVPTKKEQAKIVMTAEDLNIIAQLNFLLFRGMITQDEFNDLVQRAAAHQQLKLTKKNLAEPEAPSEAVSEKLPPLERVVGSKLSYHGGRLAFGSMALVRKIEFSTFEERLLLSCSMRFHLDDPKHKSREIGWAISRPFQEYRALYLLVSDPSGPLTPESRLALPPFPHFAFSNSAKFINKTTQEAQAKNVENWLKNVFGSIPYVEEDLYLDELPPPPPLIDPSRDPANWRTVTDYETGDKYYNNKVTGETRFEDPFAGQDDVVIQEVFMEPLPENWEAVKDPESGQTYYYNVVTEETTWDRPSSESEEEDEALRHMKEAEKRREAQGIVLRKYDIKDLLHIPAVDEFFDLKGNVEAFLESLGLLNNKPTTY